MATTKSKRKGKALPSMQQTVDRMKREIADDLADGRFDPRAREVYARNGRIETFGDLHEYVDANCYGGFCEDGVVDPWIQYYGGRDPVDEQMPQEVFDHMNGAQDRINAWIQSGGLNDCGVKRYRLDAKIVGTDGVSGYADNEDSRFCIFEFFATFKTDLSRVDLLVIKELSVSDYTIVGGGAMRVTRIA